MRRALTLAIVALFAVFVVSTANAIKKHEVVVPPVPEKPKLEGDVYQFTVEDFETNDKEMADFRNKVLLIVNTASKCGFTPQYKALQALHKKYANQGLVVIAFPSNDFGNQEPLSNAQIQEFCESRFGVEFPVMAKVRVKGDNKVDLFQWLTTQKVEPGRVRWNFEKFLISRDGLLTDRWRSRTRPTDKKITTAIERELAKKPTTQPASKLSEEGAKAE